MADTLGKLHALTVAVVLVASSPRLCTQRAADLQVADWRQRNTAAAELGRAANGLPAAVTADLWRLAAPVVEFGEWPTPNVRDVGEWGRSPAAIVTPRALVAGPETLVPRTIDDLVVAFRPQALAAFVLLHGSAPPGENQLAACIDAAIDAKERPEADLLAALVARGGDRAFLELQARLLSGKAPWTTSRPLIAVGKVLAAFGPRGREALRATAAIADEPAVRRAALVVLSASPWTGDEGILFARRVVVDASCANEALGALLQHGRETDLTPVVEVFAEAVASADLDTRRRALSSLEKLTLKDRAKARAAAVFVEQLEHCGDDWTARMLALGGLMRHAKGTLQASAFARLRELARDGDREVSVRAVRILVSSTDTDDAALLFLQQVRCGIEVGLLSAAIEAAWSVAPFARQPKLLEERLHMVVGTALRSAGPETRPALARRFATTKAIDIDPDLVPFLREQLRGKDVERVHATVAVVAAYPNELRVLEPELREMFRNDVRLPVVGPALARIAPALIPAMIEAGTLRESSASNERIEFEGAVREQIARLLEHPEGRVRAAAAAWLAADSKALPMLAKHVVDADRATRLWCVQALARAQWREYLPAALHDEVVQQLRTRLADAAVPFVEQLDAGSALRDLTVLSPADIDALVALHPSMELGNGSGWRSSSGLGITRDQPLFTRWELLWAAAKTAPTAALLTLLEEIGAASAPEDESYFEAARLLRRKLQARR